MTTPTFSHVTPCVEGRPKPKAGGAPLQDEGGAKGDLLILDLWKQGTDSIHDMCVVNTDAVF